MRVVSAYDEVSVASCVLRGRSGTTLTLPRSDSNAMLAREVSIRRRGQSVTVRAGLLGRKRAALDGRA
jgi:hypothetical protein